jgi:outer membrane lipase/esterase
MPFASIRFLLALVLLAIASAADAGPFTSLFVFGDSGSDTGRRLLLQNGAKPASPPYYNGRHSNGPMPPEYLQSALGLTGSGQFVNYAVGGARTDHDNVDTDPRLNDTGLLGQFTTFTTEYIAADPNGLYYILGGDNDINVCKTDAGNGCPQSVMDGAVDNLKTLVQGLAGMGAQHFLVIGPYGGGTNKDYFRAMLQSQMAALDSTLPGDILYFDMRPLFLDMFQNGAAYGFSHTSFDDPCYTGNLDGTDGSVCATPDSYLVWDENGHLTAPAYAVLGNAIAAAVVPVPGTLGLLLVGLLGFGASRRTTPSVPLERSPR